ncbi:hypothetical protein [Pyrococcus kukulkanii]|uniref:Uncharacterized protein n=1 Tax=Pyrococcus kukulkanii TaxID=1609559 RepID=A0A127BA59_9EURY|nr:hypothetical protein [Pyrococcus kukulkanii]AMM54117.1 hypothetical protein TQ32_06230 [Pyrococcus kukulkanii]
MEIPEIKPSIENTVCLSGDEVLSTLRDLLSSPNVRGVYAKIFGKDEKESYLIEVLTDKSRLLAIEATYVQKKVKKSGEEAIRKLAELADIPLIVTAYALDDQTFKLVLASNIDVYSRTPAVPLAEVFRRKAKETIGEAITEAKEEKEEEIKQIIKKTEEIKEEKGAKKPEVKEEVILNIKGKNNTEIPENLRRKVEDALMDYVRIVKTDIASNIPGAQLKSVKIEGEVGEGTLSMVGEFYIVAENGDPEIMKRKGLFLLHKHVPKIGRPTNLKPIIRDFKVNVVVGEEIASMEAREREDVTLWRLTRPPTTQLAPNLYLTVDSKFKQYFVGFAKTLLKEIEGDGVLVDKLEIEVFGGVREFEINIYLEGKSKDIDEPRLQARILSIAKRHASELTKIVGKYVWINRVNVTLTRPLEQELSAKAAEILKKKEEIEREVEKMLKEAGIEELGYLLEDKKKEMERTLITSRINSAVQDLKQRMQDELKAIPRANLRWLKVNYETNGNIIEVLIEASLAKLEEEGLFGALVSVSDDEIKRRATEMITRILRDVSRDHQVQIRIKKLNILVR